MGGGGGKVAFHRAWIESRCNISNFGSVATQEKKKKGTSADRVSGFFFLNPTLYDAALSGNLLAGYRPQFSQGLHLDWKCLG